MTFYHLFMMTNVSFIHYRHELLYYYYRTSENFQEKSLFLHTRVATAFTATNNEQYCAQVTIMTDCYWLTYHKTILVDTEFILVQPKTHIKNFLQSRFT